MNKGNALRTLLDQLNSEYSLSSEFRSRVSDLIDRLEGMNLNSQQIEVLAAKVRETYQRQLLIETCRDENRKTLERLQNSIQAYSNALNALNEKLQQAENALEKLLEHKPNNPEPKPPDIKPPHSALNRDKAKALAAFAHINSKNSRIN